jgi:WD40 repeat protein/uncharacterized caspase-like protein
MKFIATTLTCFFIVNISICQTPELVLPVGHTIQANLISYSPDGKLIATNTGGDDDYNVKIWEVATGKLLHDYAFFSSNPADMRFLKNGNRIFIHDKFLSLWDLKSLKQVSSFDSLPAKQIAISRDEKLIAFNPELGFDCFDSICIYSLETGKLAYQFSGGDAVCFDGIAFHPDGKSVLTYEAYYNRKRKQDENDPDTSRFILWDITNGKKIWERQFKYDKLIGHITFNSNGNYLLESFNKQIFNGKNGVQLVPEEYSDIDTVAVSHMDTVVATPTASTNFRGSGYPPPTDYHAQKDLLAYDNASDSAIQIININSWDTLLTIPMSKIYRFVNCVFSSSGDELIVMYTNDEANGNPEAEPDTEVWSIEKRKKIGQFPDKGYLKVSTVIDSQDGKTFAIPNRDGSISIRSKEHCKELASLKGYANTIEKIKFSADSSKAYVVDGANVFKTIEVKTGKIIQAIRLADNTSIDKLLLTTDEKRMVVTCNDSTLAVWHLPTATKLYQKKSASGHFYHIAIHPSDSTFIAWEALPDSLKIIDLFTGKIKKAIKIAAKISFGVDGIKFSKDGKQFFINANDAVEQRNINTSTLVKKFVIPRSEEIIFEVSPDGKLLLGMADSLAYVWDITSGKKISSFISSLPEAYARYYQQRLDLMLPAFSYAKFSPDGKRIVVGLDYSGVAQVYDSYTGKLMLNLDSIAGDKVTDAWFLDKGKIIVTRARNEFLIFWDATTGDPIVKIGYPGQGLSAADINIATGHVLTAFGSNAFMFTDGRKTSIYQSVLINEKDWLVIDSASRYDGTEAARKLLYFVCNDEPIELEQVKDQLWVPGLAERLYNGEAIGIKGISQLNICGFTPLLDDVSKDKSTYRFQITSRTGGLGDVIVLVNGIEVKRYNSTQIKKEGAGHLLEIPATELKDFLIAGQENKITAKAFTANNAIASRGLIVEEDKTNEKGIAPNLYAVAVGVSDYKGDEMDLKYAAKDANDIMYALGNASRKLLNTDGKEHVFTYNFTTDKQRYQLPEKAAIKKVLEEIGAKAQPNDILILFFAGHGVMAGTDNNKQFYFLTAEASALAATENIKETGISTTELTEWMKPQNIKAQKRILVFDACNSGQAIKDFVKIGGNDQNYLAARDDAKAQQVKAIDKLNEKSGLFILSASASNQSAYEMGRYSQGLLTYSLLKAIKQQPDILNNGKYLDLSKWFNAAKESVVELSKESGARQEPQIVTNTNFNVGIVDDEVIAKVILPSEKPLFAASNFQNSDEAIADDDLELNRLINLQLSDMAARGTDSKIIYVTATNSPDAYLLSGRYKVTGKAITVSINVKQGKTIKQKIEVTGSTDKLNELAMEVVRKSTELFK